MTTHTPLTPSLPPPTSAAARPQDVVALNVKGTAYKICRDTLTQAGGALAALADGPACEGHDVTQPPAPPRYLEVEPATFRHILNFSRHQRLPEGLTAGMLASLETEARLLQLPRLSNAVQLLQLERAFETELSQALEQEGPDDPLPKNFSLAGCRLATMLRQVGDAHAASRTRILLRYMGGDVSLGGDNDVWSRMEALLAAGTPLPGDNRLAILLLEHWDDRLLIRETLPKIVKMGYLQCFVDTWKALHAKHPDASFLFDLLERSLAEALYQARRNQHAEEDETSVISPDLQVSAETYALLPPFYGLKHSHISMKAAQARSLHAIVAQLPDDLPDRELHARRLDAQKNPLDDRAYARIACILFNRIHYRQALAHHDKVNMYQEALQALEHALASASDTSLARLGEWSETLRKKLMAEGADLPPLSELTRSRLRGCWLIPATITERMENGSHMHLRPCVQPTVSCNKSFASVV